MEGAEELRRAVQHSSDPSLSELTRLKDLGDLIDQQRASVEDDARGDRVEHECRHRQGGARRTRMARPYPNERRERVAPPERRETPRCDEIENARTDDD